MGSRTVLASGSTPMEPITPENSMKAVGRAAEPGFTLPELNMPANGWTANTTAAELFFCQMALTILANGSGVKKKARGFTTGLTTNPTPDGGLIAGPGAMGLWDNPERYLYRGEWIDGQRNGEGRALYPDGSEYFGSWKNDKRHGEGSMIYADGTIYEGSWSGNREHGEGTLTYPDGSVITAFWINGNLQIVPVEAINIAPENITLAAGGETAALIALVMPEDATYQAIIWSSSSPDVASVADGIVSPLSSGNTLITAATEDGNLTATCNVTVQTTDIAGVTLDRSSVTLRAGESTTLIAFITPDDTANTGVNWHSGNPAIVSVTDENRKYGCDQRSFTRGSMGYRHHARRAAYNPLPGYRSGSAGAIFQGCRTKIDRQKL
jgi:uncharacterized protein YjdB